MPSNIRYLCIVLRPVSERFIKVLISSQLIVGVKMFLYYFIDHETACYILKQSISLSWIIRTDEYYHGDTWHSIAGPGDHCGSGQWYGNDCQISKFYVFLQWSIMLGNCCPVRVITGMGDLDDIYQLKEEKANAPEEICVDGCVYTRCQNGT